MQPVVLWLLLLSLLVLLSFDCLQVRHVECSLNANRAQLQLLEANAKKSAQPCDDYYTYACGNWQLQQRRQYGDPQSSMLEQLDYEVNEQYAHMLERRRSSSSNPNRNETEAQLFNMARDAYVACRTLAADKSGTDAVEYTALAYLRWLAAEEHIHWPTVLPVTGVANAYKDTKDEEDKEVEEENSDYDWLELLGLLRRYGFNGVLIEESLRQLPQDARRWTIDVDMPLLNGGFEPLSKLAYLRVMSLLNVTEDNARDVARLWRTVAPLERKLKALIDAAEAVAEATTSADTSAHNSVLADVDDTQLVSLASLDMPWLGRYLRTVLALDAPLPPSTQLSVPNVRYLQALHTLLNAGDYTAEAISRYLMIRFVWYLDLASPTSFSRNECVVYARSHLPHIMAWLYERAQTQLSIAEEWPEVLRIFDTLKATFNRTLTRNAYHFRADVMSHLHSKLAHMQLKLGNLPRPHTANTLQHFYAALQLTRHDYYANQLRTLRHMERALHAQLRRHSTDDTAAYFYINQLDIDGSSSTPFYLQRWNLIVLPLTLLNRPLYRPHLHAVYRYSGLGFLLAHELMHGFDATGIDYDRRGTARTSLAQHIRNNADYERELRCLLHDPLIVDEKIADVSGLRLAYEAYFGAWHATKPWPPHWAEQHAATELFFQNFALFFCYSGIEEDIETREHGSNRERVNDAVANFAEFALAYNCTQAPSLPHHSQRDILTQSLSQRRQRQQMPEANGQHRCELWGLGTTPNATTMASFI